MTQSPRWVFKAGGLRIITTLPRTPRMNASCERVGGTLRRELPGRILILGERHGRQRRRSSAIPAPPADGRSGRIKLYSVLLSAPETRGRDGIGLEAAAMIIA